MAAPLEGDELEGIAFEGDALGGQVSALPVCCSCVLLVRVPPPPPPPPPRSNPPHSSL